MKNRQFEGWTHLELAAGNYGMDGHTRASQEKTILMKIPDVFDVETYFADLEDSGRGFYPPEDQYGVLFQTLDELVHRFGNIGVFHVNDLYEDYAKLATERLQEYAKIKGYRSVVIEAVPGDYQYLDCGKNLSKYNKKRYQSVHLKNPELSLYHDKMMGNQFFSSERSRQEARELLATLASFSEEGLYLFITYYDTEVCFVPPEEKTEFMDKNIFYRHTGQWKTVPYIFPEGNRIGEQNGKVFFIRAGLT